MRKVVRRNNINKENLSDKKICIAIIASFVVLTIQYFVLISFNLLGTSTESSVQLISKVLVGLIYLYTLPFVLNKSKLRFIVTYFIATFIFLLNFLLYPENHAYLIGLVFPFFFMCLPTFIYSMSLENLDVLKGTMKKASLIIFFIGTFLVILIFSGNATVGDYSMSLSYYMLLPTIIFIDEIMVKFSIRKFFFTLISLVVIIGLGSRGAILCIIVFVVFKLIRPDFNLNYKRAFYYLTFSGVLLLIYVFLERILMFIYKFLSNFGISSRSIQLFLGEDLHLSGRDSIYESILTRIVENPLLGIGLGGDRIVSSGYVHNLILEILANFGVIVGGIILSILLLLIFKSLITKDKKRYNMIIIWLSLGFIHLMVSSSYLIDIKFWILLGLLIRGINFRSLRQNFTRIKK